MRNVLVIATLVGTASIASADPLAVHATTTESSSSTYVATGVTVGGAGSHAAAGVSADLGEHLGGALWLHVGGTAAGEAELFGGQGRYLAGYAGLEASSCHPGDRVCAYVGGDVGYANSEFTETSWFGDSSMTEASDGAVGVLRAGLDVGNKHIRWRPGVQAAVFGPSAGAITQSIALRF